MSTFFIEWESTKSCRALRWKQSLCHATRYQTATSARTKVRLALGVLAAIGFVCEPGRLECEPGGLEYEPLKFQRCCATPTYVEREGVVVTTVGAPVEELESP